MMVLILVSSMSVVVVGFIIVWCCKYDTLRDLAVADEIFVQQQRVGSHYLNSNTAYPSLFEFEKMIVRCSCNSATYTKVSHFSSTTTSTTPTMVD
mmetsp:Transcript_24283/g.37428  ORF Transcript_24283/g.37428 Transcript_24283/m.37428 type:complete len:95 (+) Transcript_24283:1092-1376(+)